MREGAQKAMYCAVIYFVLVISISFLLAQQEDNDEFKYKEGPGYCEQLLFTFNSSLYLIKHGTI